MTPGRRRPDEERERERSGWLDPVRPAVLGFAVLVLAQVPVASAHDGTTTWGLSEGHGLLVLFGGFVVVGGTLVLKRTDRISPSNAISGVFVGIVLTAVGAILFEGLAPDPSYTASSMPIPRSWYLPLALSVGLTIIVASFLVGWLRWPRRPRYTFFGILLGLWIAYPYLLPGSASYTNPLGYAIVLATPALVGYIVWKDAWGVLRVVLRDPVARRFGIGVGLIVGLFFMASSGYLSFVLDGGTPHETIVAVLPVVYQLVSWPTFEILIPQIPLFVAISPGSLVLVGVLSVLVGLNAALIARHWHVEETAGITEGTAGTAAIAGSCTCGCCGPLVAKFTVVAAGPSLAAPLYWLFVDSASPFGVLFIVGSIALFTGSLVYSVESARESGRTASIVPAD